MLQVVSNQTEGGFVVRRVSYEYGIPACQWPNQHYATIFGEGLASISKDKNVPLCVLMALNPYVASDRYLPPGKVLCLPGLAVSCTQEAHVS